jgi:transcription elongation factor S-II
MTALLQQLASETLKQEMAQLERENMFAAQSAGATDAETDAFKCGKCGQRKTRYYQMQTRSADEPMTVSLVLGGDSKVVYSRGG